MFSSLSGISSRSSHSQRKKTFHQKHKIKSLPKLGATKLLLQLLRLGLKSSNLVITGCDKVVQRAKHFQKEREITEILA
jgi:hypothetical protein